MSQVAFIGEESIQELVPVLKQFTPTNIFIVRGKNSYHTCGAKEIVDTIQEELNCVFTSFCDFSENPKYDDVIIGVELLKKSNATIILAIGGGSVLDMAKLIRFFYSYDGCVQHGDYVKKSNLIPLVVLPTTAGTGAEATHFAVVYIDGVKYSVEHSDVLPDYAIVYPFFTYKNSAYLTACTGFDALAQAIEAYWNKNATAESDSYAERAIKMLWPNLPIVVNTPNKNVRNIISEGAYWAGKAINITKTTAPHAFSYPFTSYYGYPHGHAVALTFPFFMEVNCGTKNLNFRRIHSLLSILAIEGETDLKELMTSYIYSIGLSTLSNSSVDCNFILQHINMERLGNNPVIFDDDIRNCFLNQL